MIGMVTGMEVVAENLTREEFLNRALMRALKASGLHNLRSYNVYFHEAINQDAIIAEVRVDSSLWTGRP